MTSVNEIVFAADINPHANAMPDMQRFGLRQFLASLGPDELERHEGITDLAQVASLLEGNKRAVLFDHPAGGELPLCGNVAASRERLAKAFGTSSEDLLRVVLARLRLKGELVDVPCAAAPVQEVVLVGNECDLTSLPVHLQHGLDGAPYISASIDFTFNRENNLTNVGIRRLMLRGRRTAGIDLTAASDLRAIYLAHVKRNERTPIAFAVGSHPIDHLAAAMRVPTDELQLMAALRGERMGVVKCVTNELYVPADAQFILEGYIDERGYVEAEGPYGEVLGYYGGVKINPVFHLTAITHRRDPLFQTFSIGGRNMAQTDTAQICALRTEAVVSRSLETSVRDIRAVYALPSAGGTFNVRVAIQQRVPGEARNAIAAVFGSLANVKHVFIVDPDIDVFSDAQMEWALATRFQAERDLVIGSNFRGLPLDPSLDGGRVTDKAGFDLTLPVLPSGTPRPIEHRIPSPPTFDSERYASLDAALEAGPKLFAELMGAIGSRDGREVVRWLEDCGATRTIKRDEEGRYQFS
jgi:2,5-furandicarboxylate decarboxylase 1